VRDEKTGEFVPVTAGGRATKFASPQRSSS